MIPTCPSDHDCPYAVLGDQVLFTWMRTGVQVTGRLRSMPAGPGDTWVIHGEHGDIIHVQQFDTMRVLCRKIDAKEGHGG